ncbi:MAG: oligosaccharide flippase family protein [Candidatus Gracilibacteria bacterium]|nr:oligosaccharide flippase family protein [Candidatus Gracilibacteria bacterium]
MFKKIASNTFSQILSKAVTAIIAIFLISILTNYLSVEMYGLYSKIYNYIGIFVFLADLGLYAISIREISNDKENSSKIVGNVMTLRLILGILILFFSTGIAFFLPGYNSDLAIISIIIASIFTILQLLNSSILALMQANMKIEFSAFSLIVSKIVNVILIAFIAFVLYPKEFIADSNYFTPFIYIISAGVISVFINTILNFLYAKKITKIGFEFDYKYIKHLFKISLPYGIALFLSVVYFKIDVILLSLLEGPEKGDLSIALYSLPMKIVEVLMVIGGYYMTSLLPSLSSGFKNNDEKGLLKLTDISFKILFSFSSLLFVLGVLFRDYIIRIIANENYIVTTHMYNSSDAFVVVFFVILFYFLSLVFIYVLIGAEKQGKLLKINIFITIFNIVGNIILIPKYSFMGAGVTTLVSQILLFSFGYYYTKKILDFKFPFLFVIRGVIVGIIIYLFGFFLLNNFSIGLYSDFILYSIILFLIYSIYFYAEYKNYEKK